jgi:hypothetical protein
LFHPSAELLNGAGQSGKLLLPVCLCLELPGLLFELLLAPFQLTPAPPVFVQPHNIGQVGVGQALDLLPQARLATLQPLLTRLQLLRQPVSAMRLRQGLSDLLGMRKQCTKVGPHQLVELLGWAQARGAFLFPMREQGWQLAGAGVVALAVDRGPSQTRQAAQATADQTA